MAETNPYKIKALRHLERAKSLRLEEISFKKSLVLYTVRRDYMCVLDEILMIRLLRITHLRKTHEYLQAYFSGQIISEDAVELEKSKIARDYSGE